MTSIRTLRGRTLPLLAIASIFISSACSKGEGAPAQGPNGQGGAQRPGPAATGGGGGAQNRGPGGGGGGPGGFGGGPGGMRSGPVAIEIAQVTRGSLAREATVAGVLAPVRSVGVNAQLGGALLSVRVEEGDAVRQGQVLAEVDSREIRSQLRSAEAALVLAKSTADRSAALLKDRVVTAAEHERDQAALAAAQASAEALRTRLGYASVRAPVSGVITEKRAEAGDLIQAQGRLFTIADVSTLVVRVQVSELDISGLRERQPVDITVDAQGATKFTGVIRRIFPAADSVTRMVPVEVALTGSAVRQLKPGYLARVTVKLGERPGVLLVPASALVGSRDAYAVFIVRGDKVERKLVRLGQAGGQVVEVVEGLSAGDSVVTLGKEQVRDGGTVRIVQPLGTAAPARAGGAR